VDDSGLVTIAAVGGEAMERARQMIQALTAEPIIGETYEGTVKSTTAFGAFVEIMPGTEGLVHISELKHGRTEKTEDVVKKGDRVKVKLLERDERGRLRLSMKALTSRPEGESQSGGSGEGGEATAMAAVGASGEQADGAENGGRSERGDRPRRPRSGSRGGGRSRE
ncbi:MAG TPA: S1 RNA-binding domain-containing protein, partial [Gemmatimonadaceae bacterium]|nr:S1 RNA-binding domain-containing protein [Gemmatimonadaceae bacterium]